MTGLFFFTSIPVSVYANEVEVVDVQANQSSDKTWHFSVTLKHADAGWDHYANEWQIIAPDNKILGTRTLYHPHVNEQPFTRSLNGVKIPADVKTVRIIAKDTVHGLSTKAAQLELSSKELKQITLEIKKKTD
ncbi:MAG TPA: hypothetical protein EYH38_06545 [Leucothrix sp.]|nr:hypothetical protein [Leucothrix sp.]HIQ15212.1 hypothetical protein [Leucothrix sp.]